MSNLDIFGFRALFSPYFFLFLVFITLLYFLIVNKGYSRFGKGKKTSWQTKMFFVLAIATLYIIKGSPVDLLSHLIFSAHMTQMALLYLVVPPLFILGIPSWGFEAMLFNRWVKPLFSFATKPLISLILFNGAFSFYHLPLIFDFVKTNAFIHGSVTSFLFVASFCMWWPLMNKVNENDMSGIKKIGYIFANGVLLTPACALIIFADTPLYETYTSPEAWLQAMSLCVPVDMLGSLNISGPEMFNTLPPLEDQQLGGVLMKIIQEIVYGSILAYVFFGWARRERAKDAISPLPDDFSPSEHIVNK
ncbi:cytochrome c oxidase assembly factor CtaG [Priestia endophytica]|uniref:cytochrome c oxidase assembly factor CtaG n=1 Tax=Priestia endophytica TaxID=135735 RepID=UPI000DCA7E3B|nr:cytochrome c oxidase assembly factor CtaG [Priestia endophytica]RAS85019.1 cytochrome c oxidase assembly factor CtaG [Priestia endophytica]